MTQNKATSSGSFVENLSPCTSSSSSLVSASLQATDQQLTLYTFCSHSNVPFFARCTNSPIFAVFTLAHRCCIHSHPSLLYSLTQVHLLAACSALLAHSMYTGGRIVPAQSECVCVGVCICVYPFNKGLCVCFIKQNSAIATQVRR